MNNREKDIRSLYCNITPFEDLYHRDCCARSAHHGILFPFSFHAPACGCAPNRLCCSVQARLCHKHCRHIISLGPYLLSMTSSPYALVAVLGFSSFHFHFAPSDKSTFCHSLPFPWTLLLICYWMIVVSIAWSVHASLYYIKPNAIAW